MSDRPSQPQPDAQPKGERLLPQLAMVRYNLADLPEVEIPHPYVLRTYREGDESAWERVVAEAFGRPADFYHFDPLIRSYGNIIPDNLFFITSSDGEFVATAAGVPATSDGQVPPRLHMVGCVRGHAGKKLGYWVSLAAMRQLAADGAQKVHLVTDDFRLAAVKIYLQLDFEPYLVDENQRERWRKVFDILDSTGGWLRKHSKTLEGPVHDDSPAPG